MSIYLQLLAPAHCMSWSERLAAPARRVPSMRPDSLWPPTCAGPSSGPVDGPGRRASGAIENPALDILERNWN